MLSEELQSHERFKINCMIRVIRLGFGQNPHGSMSHKWKKKVKIKKKHIF